MAEEEDEDFEKLLAEKQHNETIKTLKSINIALGKLESSDLSVSKAIQKQSQEIVDLVEKLLSHQEPTVVRSPDVYVNQNEVIAELRSLALSIKESIESMREKKITEWEFTVERGYGNNIDKIKARAK